MKSTTSSAEGIAEGSIRPGLDARKTAFSLLYLMMGFFRMLDESGEGIERRFGGEFEELVISAVDLLTRAVGTER